jgi:hypothetical protein
MSIPLERCAEMRAEMDAGGERDLVLARAGVSADAWTEAQRAWLDKMGAELTVGRYELTQRYTQAFLAKSRALGPASPSLPSREPTGLAGGAHPVTSGVPDPDADDDPVTPRAALPPAVPPPLPAPPPHAVAQAPAAPATGAPSPWATAPRGLDAADPAAAPTPIAPAPGAIPETDETVQPGPSPLRTALPFRPGPSPAATASEVPRPRPPPAELGGTVMGVISPFATVLPFAAGDGAKPPVTTPAPAAPAAPRVTTGEAPRPTAQPAVPGKPSPPPLPPKRDYPKVVAPRPELVATAAGSNARFGPALPFPTAAAAAPAATPPSTTATPFAAPPPATPPPPQAPAAAPAPPLVAQAAPAPARVAPPAPVAAPAPAPAPAPAAAPAPAPAAAPTPVAAPGPLLVGGLTLKQHASLCAEMAAAPTQLDEVLARYRVTSQAKGEMDEAWKARFAVDPSLQPKWHEAYRLYFAFLQSARRR